VVLGTYHSSNGGLLKIRLWSRLTWTKGETLSLK
jgi:hypothetical protein